MNEKAMVSSHMARYISRPWRVMLCTKASREQLLFWRYRCCSRYWAVREEQGEMMPLRREETSRSFRPLGTPRWPVVAAEGALVNQELGVGERLAGEAPALLTAPHTILRFPVRRRLPALPIPTATGRSRLPCA
jgi:hypothetical protein